MNDMTYPLITIGLTTYNSGEALKRGLKSVAEQQYPNYEIIILDDGSQDNTINYLKAFAKKDKRVKLLLHDNNYGVSQARNVITHHASGDYIAFFDHDDYSLPHRLSAQYQRIKAFEQEYGHDKAVFCYHNRINMGAEIQHFFYGSGYQEPLPHGEIIIKYIIKRCILENKSIGVVGKPSKFEPYADNLRTVISDPNICDGFSCAEQGAGTLMTSKKTMQSIAFDVNLRAREDWDICIRLGEIGGYMVAVNDILTLVYKSTNIEKQHHHHHAKSSFQKKYQHYINQFIDEYD